MTIDEPSVSIIIRTVNRPALAMEAVKSALAQTHAGVEVILVEDGPATCQSHLDRLEGKNRVNYVALGQNQGRSAAGNEGLARARGAYLNFLDDDDLLYPEHVACLMDLLGGAPGIAYAGWETVPVKLISLDPQILRQIGKPKKSFVPFDRLSLLVGNFLPIQAVLFHRSYFDDLGGLDLDLDAFEDWELWCRYSVRGEFISINRNTSLVRIPHSREAKKKRSDGYERDWNEAKMKVESLPIGLENVDIHALVRFAKHYAMRNKYSKISAKMQKILKILCLERVDKDIHT